MDVQLIQLLQRLKMSAALQDARQQMHLLFPLTEDMWLAWLGDQRVNQQPEQLHALSAEAIQDYLSIPLWEQYVRSGLCPWNCTLLLLLVSRRVVSNG